MTIAMLPTDLGVCPSSARIPVGHAPGRLPVLPVANQLTVLHPDAIIHADVESE